MTRALVVSLTILPFAVSPAAAYVGPGLGLGVLGAIAGVALSLLLAVVALFWYPLKRLLKGRKKQDKKVAEEH